MSLHVMHVFLISFFKSGIAIENSILTEVKFFQTVYINCNRVYYTASEITIV